MGVVEPRFRWVFSPAVAVSPDLSAAASARGVSERMLEVLVARGVTGRTDLDAWFREPLDALHDPR
ncbi:hypothetical protein NL526_29715, partial [Klebsiella pneumoniae]|nr:hypothetical protein [Klebsiella pneumoniae]